MLEAVLPKSIRYSEHKGWQAKDKELAGRLPDVVEAILSKRPPERITRLRCSKGLGYDLTDQRIPHLPETLAALDQVVETPEAFRVRNPARPGCKRRPLRHASTG